MPEAMLDRLNRLAAFQNPEFYKAQAYDKPRVIGCAEEVPHFLALPRGLLDKVELLFSRHKITAKTEDLPGPCETSSRTPSRSCSSTMKVSFALAQRSVKPSPPRF
ncbi:MAG TPA: hypothetical protein VNH18_23920 [Bryobacteraceae bacterium]|nr:hypothetical protein [Bryobacteraceae bacterium]